MIPTALVFDADNILWDTDSVFRRAQLAILEVFVKEGLIGNADLELGKLRLMDRALANRLGTAEYNPAILVTALHRHYSRDETVNESVEWAAQQNFQVTSLAKSACDVFSRTLEEIPPLFEDAEELLLALHTSRSAGLPVVTLLFSEGDPNRVKRIIEAHKLGKRTLFDQIILEEKSVKTFESAGLLALGLLSRFPNQPNATLVMIGDSLKRDIAFANRAGFVTVYKPSHFLGDEISSCRDDEPRYRVSSLLELPRLLAELGVPVLKQIHGANPAREMTTQLETKL